VLSSVSSFFLAFSSSFVFLPPHAPCFVARIPLLLHVKLCRARFFPFPPPLADSGIGPPFSPMVSAPFYTPPLSGAPLGVLLYLVSLPIGFAPASTLCRSRQGLVVVWLQRLMDIDG
jgi:hypothetical protein